MTSASALLFAKEDGLWVVVESPDGQIAWVNLTALDHGPIVNSVLAETHRRLSVGSERCYMCDGDGYGEMAGNCARCGGSGKLV